MNQQQLSFEGLSHAGALVIYGRTGWSPSVMASDPQDLFIDVEVLETSRVGLTWVTFCGEKFCADSLLSLPGCGYSPYIEELATLVDALNKIGVLAQTDRGALEIRTFLETGNGKSAIFMGALDRMTKFTSWKFRYDSSRINPRGGLDILLVVPE